MSDAEDVLAGALWEMDSVLPGQIDAAYLIELLAIQGYELRRVLDGTLVLDTAGEYRYQCVGEKFIDGRTQLVYRRIQR